MYTKNSVSMVAICIMSTRNFMRASSKALFQRLGSKKSHHAVQPWRVETNKKVLETTGLTFRLKFLGMRVVNGSMDVKGCVQALRELDLSCAEGKYRVLLTLSPMRVHLVQYPWKLVCDHSTRDISYCCSDLRNPRLFAYITKQRNTGTHICICLKTFSNTETTGKGLVDAFTHAFSCHKSITSFSSLKTVGTTDQVENNTSCVKDFRFKGLPHYHTQLFNGNSVISKRSKMIKEGSKLRASATSLTHKQVPCTLSCNSNMPNETRSTKLLGLSAEKLSATRVHGECCSIKTETESIGQSTLQGTSTSEENQKKKEVPRSRVLPLLKVRSYPPPPPPPQMNNQFQTHPKSFKQPVHENNAAIHLDTPNSSRISKEQKSVARHGNHKQLCSPSTPRFSCSFERFGATFTVPLIVAFSILHQLSSP